MLKRLRHMLASIFAHERGSKPSIDLDDRTHEIVAWVNERPRQQHIIAVRTAHTKVFLEAYYANMNIDVQVFSIGRLCSGIFFRLDNACLSCTHTLVNEPQYRQLLNRLRGANPVYNVAIHPAVVLHEPTLPTVKRDPPGPDTPNGSDL